MAADRYTDLRRGGVGAIITLIYVVAYAIFVLLILSAIGVVINTRRKNMAERMENERRRRKKPDE